MSMFEKLKKVDDILQKQFIWTEDLKVYGKLESWNDRWAEFKEGRTVRDDCDGRAWSGCRGLIEEGFDPSDVAFFLVLTETGQLINSTAPYDHAIFGARIEGQWWISDNRFIGIHKPNYFSYKWHSMMALDKPGEFIRVERDSGPQS